MKLDRRNFIKGSLGLGLLVSAGALGACSPKKAGTDKNKTEANKPDHFSDGKWIGRAMGHRDYLTVSIDVAHSDLSNIEVLRCDETIGIGTVAAPMMVDRIMAQKNLDVDAISGATRTSMAIKEAIKSAIESAGGNPADYEKGGTEQELKDDREEEADVVVVGAGSAGLIAAVRLLEAGKRVIVVEKLDIPGGSGNMVYSGILAVNSKLQKNYALGRKNDANLSDFSFEERIKVVKSYNTAENNRFNGEVPYQSALYSNSGSMVDWLHDMGVGFFTMGTNAYGTTPVLSPGYYMGGAGYCMQFLADRISALGGSLYYGTEMTDFLQNDVGSVIGIQTMEVRSKSKLTVRAKAVCMTTGGFAANKDMVRKYYPAYTDYDFNCCKGSTGEGMQLVVNAGATVECMDRELGAFCSTTSDAAGSRFEVAFLQTFAPGVFVNSDGDEFGKGPFTHASTGAAAKDPANGGRFFQITDRAGSLMLEKFDKWACTDYACLFSRGDIVKYDSIEAAADALKLPHLMETIGKHNEHALAGELDEFERKCTFINENEGIYAISTVPTFYLTTGGVSIDTSGHVLTEKGEVLPGLYAAGDICGSIEEKDGNTYGYGFDSAMTYGYIMANTIIEEL